MLSDHQYQLGFEPTELDIHLARGEQLRRLVTKIRTYDARDVRYKDSLGLCLLVRCIRNHEAIETLLDKLFLSDAWVLARASIEYGVNSAYMFYVANDQTARDYRDYSTYGVLNRFLNSKEEAGETLFRDFASLEKEECVRAEFNAIRSRFEKNGRRGDKWCSDDRLYKRAKKVDQALGAILECDCNMYLRLVNSVWRDGSGHVHGELGAMTEEVTLRPGRVAYERASIEDAAHLAQSVNFNLWLLLLMVDARFGGRNAREIAMNCPRANSFPLKGFAAG